MNKEKQDTHKLAGSLTDVQDWIAERYPHRWHHARAAHYLDMGDHWLVKAGYEKASWEVNKYD